MIRANGSLFYGGMQNVNEEHTTGPTYQFTISLVSSNFGLPAPQVISLSSVISTNLSATGHYDIFDPTRATGGEHFQGMRVRINGLTLVTTVVGTRIRIGVRAIARRRMAKAGIPADSSAV